MIINQTHTQEYTPILLLFKKQSPHLQPPSSDDPGIIHGACPRSHLSGGSWLRDGSLAWLPVSQVNLVYLSRLILTFSTSEGQEAARLSEVRPPPEDEDGLCVRACVYVSIRDSSQQLRPVRSTTSRLHRQTVGNSRCAPVRFRAHMSPPRPSRTSESRKHPPAVRESASKHGGGRPSGPG